MHCFFKCVVFCLHFQGNFREANFQKAMDKLNDGGQPEAKGRKGGSKGSCTTILLISVIPLFLTYTHNLVLKIIWLVQVGGERGIHMYFRRPTALLLIISMFKLVPSFLQVHQVASR